MKKYKVLLVTEFGKPYNSGWYYKSGLEKNGHTVIPFDPETVEDPKSKVIEIVKASSPDFILHTKDELPAETLQELRQLTKVVMWYPDPVIPEWLVPYVKACDIFFTMSEGLIQDFKKYNENVLWLSQAFEPSFFEVKEITGEDKRIFSADVAFVGNLGSKGQYLSRRASLEKVIDAGFKFRWWGPKIPRKFSTVPLLLGKIGRAYGGRFVWGEGYAKVARLSKIFLAFDSMPHIRKSMSARMYTAVGCGAFYMCRHVEGIEEVLLPGKEIITFRSENEMTDLIRYYLENDALRMKIAEAGRMRVLKDHTYEVRARQMLELLKGTGI
ncbi:MAG: glycosyltransferase [Nitrospirae bacterium]|nr:glycosyltransferase [Nitrospirota bacterium]